MSDHESRDDITESIDDHEFSGYNIQDSSISDIINLQNKIYIQQIRIMHSENLLSMIVKFIIILNINQCQLQLFQQGISRFSRLEEINLSSNNIFKIEGLNGLNNLKVLNLSCNKLTEISGLETLFKLENLIVSHNKITNIDGLQEMAGSNYHIKSIDLKNNKIREVKQLQFLQDLSKLQELCLEIGKNSNPLCTDNRQIYYQGLCSMKNFQRIVRIDGQTPDNIVENMKYQGQTQNQNINTLNKIVTLSNSENVRSLSSEVQTYVKQAQAMPIHSSGQNYHTQVQNQMSFNEQSANKKHFHKEQGDQLGDNQRWRGDHLQIQQDLEQAILIQKELINKYEVNDKLWLQKYEKLQEEFSQIEEDNKQKGQRIKVMTNEKSFLEEQISEIKNERILMLNKTEKRDEILETLQIRITDLIKENGQYYRELSARSDQIDKQKSEIIDLSQELIEMKGKLKENEQSLSEFHRKALEQANINLQRNEDIRKKYEFTLDEYKLVSNENSNLKQNVQELIEISREWENKFEKKVDELNYKYEQQIRDIQQQFNDREQQNENQMRDWEKIKEEEFKESVELMEQEFKKYLFENNKKFRDLKEDYEEKCKQESDSHHLMKVAVQKNSDQAILIEELQSTLLQIKKEVNEIINGKNNVQKELDTKKSVYIKDVQNLEEERDRLLHEKMSLDRQLQDLQEIGISETHELELLRDKMKYYENIEEKFEKCQETIQAKNIMLDDKNDTIKDIKKQLEQFRQREQQSTDDLNKLQKKYDKQTQIIEDLELQLQQSNEDIEQATEDQNNMRKELDKKKKIIELFQYEIDSIKTKQDKEVNEKNNRIKEILILLEECKQNIKRKEEYIQEIQNEIKTQILSYTNELRLKDLLVTDLDYKLQLTQQQLQQQQIDQDKSKKQAKQQIQLLQNLFNI